jgi:acyl-CoA thioester hydrolase
MLVQFGVDLVLAEAQVRYRAPARFDDLLDVTLTVTTLGTTSMTLALAVTRDGDELIDGELRYVFVEPEGWAKAPMPDALRAALEAYAS